MNQFNLGTVNILSDLVTNAIPFLSDQWKSENTGLLKQESLELLSKGMRDLFSDNFIPNTRLPKFEEEVMPNIDEVKQYFKEVIIVNNQGQSSSTNYIKLAQKIENAPFEYLLILMGQRFTPASIKDRTAFPPSNSKLIDSCFRKYNDQICIATRAWEKHVGRSDDQYWGKIEGNATEKDKQVKTLILKMMKEKTWWNIFFHYKHELVYEIRVSSGHGIRWSRDGTQLIGFLEPFL